MFFKHFIVFFLPEPLKNPRKSRFVHQKSGNFDKKEDELENSKEMEEKMKAIRRRHTLIGKKVYDDQELAKIDLNCYFFPFSKILMLFLKRWAEFCLKKK